MILSILYILAGLVLLFFGGEGLVRGSVALATRFGLSTLLVSMVVVGFGTSAPELLVSLQAAFAGTSDIALGNVIGSNISNIFLILGVASLITPVLCEGPDIKRDAIMGMLAVVLLAAISFTHELGRIEGAVMFILLMAYIVWSYRADRKKTVSEMVEMADHREHLQQDIKPPKKESALKDILWVVAGLVLLVVGAHLLVDGAVTIARMLNVPDAVIGLTLVAVGTSLPELATAIVASIRRHSDVVIGNILGSNLFNVLCILGITGMVAPMPFTGRIAEIDVWVALAASVVLLGLIYVMRRVGRSTGIGFLAIYMAYTVWLFIG